MIETMASVLSIDEETIKGVGGRWSHKCWNEHLLGVGRIPGKINTESHCGRQEQTFFPHPTYSLRRSVPSAWPMKTNVSLSFRTKNESTY